MEYRQGIEMEEKILFECIGLALGVICIETELFVRLVWIVNNLKE